MNDEQPKKRGFAQCAGGKGGHWYTMAGKPMHEVPGQNGEMRPTTLADARKLKLLPSVTTIIGEVLAKPQLEEYKERQVAYAILRAEMKQDESVPDFVTRIIQQERRHEEDRDRAAQRGTDAHRLLENHLHHPELDGKLAPAQLRIVAAVRALPLIAGSKLVSAEQQVVGDGYAGTTDLQLFERRGFMDLGDFKMTRSVPAKKPWREHRLQSAAYCAALTRMGAVPKGKRLRGWVVYIDAVTGFVVAHEVQEWEKVYLRGFRPLLTHWQWDRNYRPKQPKLKPKAKK